MAKENCRCSICNKVSSPGIQTNYGEYSKKPFVPDPKDPLYFICMDCKEAHETTMLDYQRQDELKYGWLYFYPDINNNDNEDDND